ncbi:MAG: right-handed parallel beta-helix repeat-containing protein, partial [Armatimonadota bacterium]
LPATLALTAEDSGTAQAPVVWQAYPGEKPLLLGGKTINGFEPYKGQILKAEVGAQGLKGVYFRQLYFKGVKQNLARTPNFDPKNPYGGGWAYADGKLVPMYTDIPGEDKRTLKYAGDDVPEMAKPAEAEVFVFPRYNWWNNCVPVKSVDRATRTVTLAADCSYAIRPRDRYYVRNVFEALDAPGEWYLDKETSTLYFWPPAPITKDSVSAPALETLITLDKAAYVTLQGFTLEGCDGNGVVLSGCDHCTVAGCEIRNTVGRWSWGDSAVTVSGTNNTVVGCDIHDTGGHAISISGGDRITLTAANNVADNNYIHHVGQMYKQGVGISLTGVGNKATHNLIHDGPRMGIMFSGNNLLLEYNEIRHMNLETEDTGAVYTGGRDWISSRGSVVRYNYFHDILGYGHDEKGRWVSPRFAWGVYLDDNTGGVDVIGNIVARCPLALVHLHNGRDNNIENNILISGGQQQIQYSGWTDKHPYWINFSPNMLEWYNKVKDQPAWQGTRYMDISPDKAVLPDHTIMAHNFVKRNIIYWNSPTAVLYRWGNVNFEVNEFDSNCVFNAAGPVSVGLKGIDAKDQWAEWQKLGRDTHSLVADPLFVDAAKDDYRLKDNSPAYKLGFQRIPTRLIGPYKSPLRASWPIVQAEGAREHPIISEPVTEGNAGPDPRYKNPVAVVKTAQAPVIDGKIEAGEWPAAQFRIAEGPGREALPSPASSASVAYDANYLYLALTVPLRASDKLSTGNSWGSDDGTEVCMQSLAKGAPIYVLHGFTAGQFESVSDAGVKADLAKKLATGTKYAAQATADAWTGEWAIPLNELGVAGQAGSKLRFNLGVRRQAANEWVMWAGTLAQTWVVENAGMLELK